MGELQFETDAKDVSTPQPHSRGFDMIDFLVRKGVARDRRVAQQMLVGVVVLSVIVALILWPRPARTPTTDEIVRQAGQPGIRLTH